MVLTSRTSLPVLVMSAHPTNSYAPRKARSAGSVSRAVWPARICNKQLFVQRRQLPRNMRAQLDIARSDQRATRLAEACRIDTEPAAKTPNAEDWVVEHVGCFRLKGELRPFRQ